MSKTLEVFCFSQVLWRCLLWSLQTLQGVRLFKPHFLLPIGTVSSSSDPILFLYLFFISWRLITLQYCSGFCHTLIWISHGYTCIPHFKYYLVLCFIQYRTIHTLLYYPLTIHLLGLPDGLDSKGSSCNSGDPGLIPESGRSPGEGNDNPLQDSCLENSTDRGAWQATVHGVTELETTELLTLSLCHVFKPQKDWLCFFLR